MHPAVKAECSRQFLPCSLCNNKPYAGLGRRSPVKWVIGQRQRLGDSPSFFWEGEGRQRDVQYGKKTEGDEEKQIGGPGTKWS